MVKLMRNKKIKALMATLILCSMALSCLTSCFLLPSGDATSITLDQQKATIRVGETLTLTATTDKADAEVTWVSDATHIAKVEGGVVTAVAEGEAIITARSGSAKAYCKVVVKPARQDLFVEGALADVYKDYFVIGTAVKSTYLESGYYGDVIKHFNSITPLNNMKWRNLESIKGSLDFDQLDDSADDLVAWAKANGVPVRGHTLLWYKAVPIWLHEEFKGKEYSEQVSEYAISLIEEHVELVMEHFGDDVYVWDVVNEAISNSVKQSDLVTSVDKPYGNIWRTSADEDDGMEAHETDWVDWYKVTGGYEYIAKAFLKAGQVREENNLNVQLFYNDYGLYKPTKRQAALNLVQMLRDNGAPIDGIGMQCHIKLKEYTEDKALFLKNFEDSIKAFIDAGLDVQITELDLRHDTVFSEQNAADQAELFGEIFRICRKYAKTGDMEHGVTGITTWGPYDGCYGGTGEKSNKDIFGPDQTLKAPYYAIVKFED
jgi:GH35 family endo-1,4-beta-xylanase